MQPNPGERFGPYVVDSLLGRGGMGDVYLATDTRLDRRVALKLLAPRYLEQDEFRERFLRETRTAASLDNPHIVPVYEAGEIDGQPFIAMRYVDGAGADAMLRESGALEPARAVRIIADVARALDAAHTAGVIHRDVKPGNILVSKTPTGEHAYLSDFGLTKAINDGQGVTRTGQLMGTAHYLAPEQIEGQPADGRADVYALACVLFELLTGAPPFVRESEMATLFAHVHAERPSVLGPQPNLPEALEDVVAKGMAVKPDERYATAGELAQSAADALEPTSDWVTMAMPESTPAPTGGVMVTEAAEDASAAQDPPGEIGAPTVVDRARPASGLTELIEVNTVPAADDSPDLPSAQLAPDPAWSATDAPVEQPVEQPAQSILVGRPTGSRQRRVPVAIAALAILALAVAVLAAMGLFSGVANQPSASRDGAAGATDAVDGVASGEPGQGGAFECAPRAVSAGSPGRWRLVRAEYGPRDTFDYLRLVLRREGDHEQTPGLEASIVERDDVTDAYGVDNVPEGDVAVVIAFSGPVDIGGSWERSPGYGALRGFRIQRGREGQVHVVAGVRGEGCYRLLPGSWTNVDARTAEVTLEIQKN